MKQNRLDLYTDYLSVTFGCATATGLSNMLDGGISHDAITGWLKGLDFPVRLARQVFKNKDCSEGILYLACSKLDAGWDEITTTPFTPATAQ